MNGTQIEVTRNGAFACVLGGAISIALPGLIPGVLLMCLLILTMDV